MWAAVGVSISNAVAMRNIHFLLMATLLGTGHPTTRPQSCRHRFIIPVVEAHVSAMFFAEVKGTVQR
jgi:hypothetical protein